MQLVICAGPLCAGLVPPEVDGIESFVRPARTGEAAATGCCPTCSGSGVRTFRRRTLRCVSTCQTCTGSGSVEGMFLARVVGDEGSPAVMQFLAWAREHRVRTDVQMAVRDKRGAGWALAWRGLDSRPLRRWRDRLVAREALAIFVDQDDVHVALHAVRDDGRVAIAGIWDVRMADDGALIRTWSERASRSLAWRRRIRFPSETVQQTLQQARTTSAAAHPARRHARPAHRTQPPPATLAPQTASPATN